MYFESMIMDQSFEYIIRIYLFSIIHFAAQTFICIQTKYLENHASFVDIPIIFHIHT